MTDLDDLIETSPLPLVATLKLLLGGFDAVLLELNCTSRGLDDERAILTLEVVSETLITCAEIITDEMQASIQLETA